MYNIKISPEARNDLLEIKDYISKELCNVQAAVNLVSKIMKKIRSLSEYCEIGVPLSSIIIDIQTDYRFLICDNYLVFYRNHGEIVYVSRILYGRRDYTRILLRELIDSEEKL
ncbi:UNVERIFIED_CONTAM: addiction module RelE/StbE family toxin [Acetivibrio alkalicellulosi]